ncbi:hypothetical protein [Sulfurimonas autotrophica]|uniref:Uncharacterized protein n=1 Tax=Sulfurimonas autotrophica (strain ATCC BAA-671 / DSM 16294 / JCM 11897 / OK10) TaxID=563040 RepID=E0UQ78_SULAO|nr:hypothetical protein [Sulfurimonas autotrophica]ADN09821.1 hypothetical protein Saut_1777 [Sulfurimonas autotrophica DSM 16294]
MAIYTSDGKKLINVEFDVTPQVGDIVDSMRVLSVNKKNNDEYAVFLLEPNTRVTCYIFDEVFIIGKESGFESLNDAVAAWKNDEI